MLRRGYIFDKVQFYFFYFHSLTYLLSDMHTHTNLTWLWIVFTCFKLLSILVQHLCNNDVSLRQKRLSFPHRVFFALLMTLWCQKSILTSTFDQTSMTNILSVGCPSLREFVVVIYEGLTVLFPQHQFLQGCTRLLGLQQIGIRSFNMLLLLVE